MKELNVVLGVQVDTESDAFAVPLSTSNVPSTTSYISAVIGNAVKEIDNASPLDIAVSTKATTSNDGAPAFLLIEEEMEASLESCKL